jgi:hypothetical protein
MPDVARESGVSVGYSTVLDKSLFEAQREDEIILCLNCDGLYGINNVNRFLQSSNRNRAITRGRTGRACRRRCRGGWADPSSRTT